MVERKCFRESNPTGRWWRMLWVRVVQMRMQKRWFWETGKEGEGRCGDCMRISSGKNQKWLLSFYSSRVTFTKLYLLRCPGHFSIIVYTQQKTSCVGEKSQSLNSEGLVFKVIVSNMYLWEINLNCLRNPLLISCQ